MDNLGIRSFEDEDEHEHEMVRQAHEEFLFYSTNKSYKKMKA